jgi:ParB-like chromosome segregation protein Spo0J
MPPRRRAEDPTLTSRNGAIWRAYVEGATQEALADQYDLSRQRIGQILGDIRATIPEPDRSQIVQRELDFLDQLRRTALDLVNRPPIPAYSNGKPILMDDGSTAEDHSGRLSALDRAVKLHERLTRLLGLEAAEKVAITGGVKYEIVGVNVDDLK